MPKFGLAWLGVVSSLIYLSTYVHIYVTAKTDTHTYILTNFCASADDCDVDASSAVALPVPLLAASALPHRF